MVIGVLDWLTDLFAQFAPTKQGVAIGVGIFLGTLIGSLALVAFFLTRLPPSYFHPSYDRRPNRDRHWAIRCAGVLAKNAIGLLLVILGVVMSLPWIPGQGLLTILVGIMLIDFPGKRVLEYKLIRQPRILRAVNRLRQAFSKPPLLLE